MSRIRDDEPTRNESRRRAEGLRIIPACHPRALPGRDDPASVRAGAQDPGQPPRPASAAAPRPPGPSRLSQPAARTSRQACRWDAGPELRPGVSVVGPIITPEGHGPEGPPALDPKVQVVRFSGPDGPERRGPRPEPSPVPVGDGGGIATVGLRARRRLSPPAQRTSPSGPASSSSP